MRMRRTVPRPLLPKTRSPTASSSLSLRISSEVLPPRRWACVTAHPDSSIRLTCSSRISCPWRLSSLFTKAWANPGTSCQTCATWSSDWLLFARSTTASVARLASSEPSVASRILVGNALISYSFCPQIHPRPCSEYYQHRALQAVEHASMRLNHSCQNRLKRSAKRMNPFADHALSYQLALFLLTA